MPKRPSNHTENKNTMKSCKLDTSNGKNSVSNVKNFYGSKRPMPNRRWMPKKIVEDSLRSSKELINNNICNVEPLVSQTVNENANKKRCSKSRTTLVKSSSGENCPSPRRTPKRYCKRDDITMSSPKYPIAENCSALRRTPKRLCKLDNISNSQSMIDNQKADNQRQKLTNPSHDNKPLSNNNKRETDNQIQKLKILSQEIDKIEDILEEANKISSMQTQTSLSSSQDTNTLTSASNSPVTSCRSSPFSATKHPTIHQENIINCKDAELEELDNSSKGYFKESPLEEEEEEEEVYEMFSCDLESHDTSVRSECSDTSSTSPKKTPKSNKTILNYFSRVNATQSETKSKKIKSPAHAGKETHKSSNSQKQLHFSNKGLSPKATTLNLPFDLPTLTKTPSKNKRKNMKNKANSMEQMYIDIGQKDFGHVKCETCGMVYTKCQEEDEAQHAKYHQNIVQKLKFNGWKNERVLEEFHDGRIICIQKNDYFMHLKKFAEIREVVDTELGFVTSTNLDLNDDEQAFLFIAYKKVIGCAIAVSIRKAYPVLVNPRASHVEKEESSTQSWCCSSEPVKAVCGISRIWVFSKNRRQKIASRLVDCLRHNFLYGCVIDKDLLAFSDPTPNGRTFAEKYVGKKEFLVFR